MSSKVRIERDGLITTVVINRPEVRDAAIAAEGQAGAARFASGAGRGGKFGE